MRGWASAQVGDWHGQVAVTHDPWGLVRDDHSPLTMTGQEEVNDEDGTCQPPVSKPLCAPQDSAEVRQKVMSAQKLVGDRLAILKQRSRDMKQGKKSVGMVKICEWRRMIEVHSRSSGAQT